MRIGAIGFLPHPTFSIVVFGSSAHILGNHSFSKLSSKVSVHFLPVLHNHFIPCLKLYFAAKRFHQNLFYLKSIALRDLD